MKRVVLLILIFTLILTGCTPKAPQPPSGSSGGNQPVVTNTVTALSAHVQYLNPNTGDLGLIEVLLDLPSSKRVPFFGQSHLTFLLDKNPTDQQIATLGTTFKYSRDHRTLSGLLNDTDPLELPEWLVDTVGKAIVLEPYTAPALDSPTAIYQKGYEQFKLSRSGGFPYALGDELVLELNWPFKKSSVEAAISESLANCKYTLTWIDERKAILVITETSDLGVYLKVQQLIDTNNGAVHMPLRGAYLLRITPPMSIKGVNLATKAEVAYPLPLAVTGIHSVNSSSGIAQLSSQHIIETDPGLYVWSHNFDYNLASRSVTNHTETHETGFYDYQKALKAQALMAPYTVDNPDFIWLGSYILSPSGAKVAALGGHAADSYVLIADLKNGKLTKHALGTYQSLGFYLPPVTWSYDEKYIVYGTYDPNDPNSYEVIYQVDAATGKQTELARIQGSFIGVSPVSEHVIVSTGFTQYLIDSKGNTIELKLDGAQTLAIAAWVSPTKVVVNSLLQGETRLASYTYDLLTHQADFLAWGRAQYYEPATNTVFLLDGYSEADYRGAP